MSLTVYEVTGHTAFQGFRPGEKFAGQLEPRLEERAIARGSIAIVDRGTASLDLTRVRMPRGWDSSVQHRERSQTA